MAAATFVKIVLKVFNPFLIVLTYILVFASLIVIPVLLSPLFIYRLCVIKCSKWFRPDLVDILPCGNSIMLSYDEAYSSERNDNTTVIALKVDGNILDINQVRQNTTEKLINAKTSEGILKYPELKQYPVKWMGYYFWKPVQNFDINYHVDYYSPPDDGKFYSEEEAALVEAELVTKDHKKENAPWQIQILPNVKSKPEDIPFSIVYFRTHHGLMDGYALFQLILGDLGGKDMSKFLAQASKKILNEILYFIVFLFRFPLDVAIDTIVPGFGAGAANCFRLDFKDLSREQIGTKALPIPLKYLKEIRKAHNVAIGSVITAAWIGGLRRMLSHLNMKIPEVATFGCPLPMPGHSGKLRVHASAAVLVLPIGKKDPIKRLHYIDKYLASIKNSTSSIYIYRLKPIIGKFMLPFMIDAMVPRVSPTGAVNIFASTTEPFLLFGQQVKDVYFSYGQQKFRSSILFSSLTYCDTIYMKTAVNKNLFSQQANVDKINGFILEELDYLCQHATV